MIFYESPHRVVRALTEMAATFGDDRRCSVCREISKLHEESVRGTLQEAARHFEENEPRGEFVIIVAGCEDDEASHRQRRKPIAKDPITGQPIYE